MKRATTATFPQRGWSRSSGSLLALVAFTSLPGWSESSRISPEHADQTERRTWFLNQIVTEL